MSDETRAARSLEYAGPDLNHRAPARIDYAVIVLSVVQILLALFWLFFHVSQSARGYTEISTVPWYVRAAWNFGGGVWILLAWLFASFFVNFAATRPPGRRLALYAVYASAWVIALLLGLLATYTLDQANFSYRWVSTLYGKPDPQFWISYAVESAYYWQLPLIMAITNPVIVLLLLRTLAWTQKRA